MNEWKTTKASWDIAKPLWNQRLDRFLVEQQPRSLIVLDLLIYLFWARGFGVGQMITLGATCSARHRCIRPIDSSSSNSHCLPSDHHTISTQAFWPIRCLPTAARHSHWKEEEERGWRISLFILTFPAYHLPPFFWGFQWVSTAGDPSDSARPSCWINDPVTKKV